MSPIATRAPSRTSAAAVDFPIPRAAPLIATTRPAKFLGCFGMSLLVLAPRADSGKILWPRPVGGAIRSYSCTCNGSHLQVRTLRQGNGRRGRPERRCRGVPCPGREAQHGPDAARATEAEELGAGANHTAPAGTRAEEDDRRDQPRPGRRSEERQRDCALAQAGAPLDSPPCGRL